MVGDECYNYFVIKATRMITTSRKVFSLQISVISTLLFFCYSFFSLSLYDVRLSAGLSV